MIHIVLASHGRLAQGMKESIGLIMGRTDSIDTICAYCEPDLTLGEQIDRALAACDPKDLTVVVTDVFGGSVNNEFIKRMPAMGFHLIAGMNMALIIQLMTMDIGSDPAKALAEALKQAQSSMIYCNSLLQQCAAGEEDF